MIYARRAVIVCLVAAVFAPGAPGCGARSEIEGPISSISCPQEQASSHTSENCHRYCNVYQCLACPETATRCEEACLATAGAALSSQLNPSFGECLACAVQHVNRLAPRLDCMDDVRPDDAGQAKFSMTYPIDECPVCSP